MYCGSNTTFKKIDKIMCKSPSKKYYDEKNMLKNNFVDNPIAIPNTFLAYSQILKLKPYSERKKINKIISNNFIYQISTYNTYIFVKKKVLINTIASKLN